MSRIEVRGNGRRILVPTLIFTPDQNDLRSVETTALLDTGATASGITAEIADRLELRGMGKRPMGSARGVDQVQRFLFRLGLQPDDASGAFPYVFEPVLGFEITPGSSFDALIGMDLLEQCQLVLERGRRCVLTFG
jgi:hypothetical protein